MINVEAGNINYDPIIIGCDAYYDIEWNFDTTGFDFDTELYKGDTKIENWTIETDNITNKSIMGIARAYSKDLTRGVYRWVVLQTDPYGEINKVYGGEIKVKFDYE
jgi:hypothetical protein